MMENGVVRLVVCVCVCVCVCLCVCLFLCFDSSYLLSFIHRRLYKSDVTVTVSVVTFCLAVIKKSKRRRKKGV